MKIALVYDAIYPYLKGGGEKRFYEIGRRLAEKGHQVHLYGMKFWKGANVIRQDKIYLHGICKARKLYTKEGRRSILEAIYFGFCSMKLIKEDFDIIDCCGFPYFSLFSCKLISLIKRKKLFSTWHEVWGLKYWRKYLGKPGALGYLIEKLSASMPETIISVSRMTAGRIKNELGSRKKIYIIENGIDFDRIRQVNAAGEKFDVVYAGRLVDHKNVDILIRTIHKIKGQIPTVKCLILGEGPEKEKLETLTWKLNLKKNIKFMDFLENSDDVFAFMKSSKVFVLPSTREGFGIVAAEANACGIPVITTDCEDNATKDLIQEEKNGFICQPEEEEIAKRIIEILRDNPESNIERDCMNSVKKYDWGNIVDRIEGIYLE